MLNPATDLQGSIISLAASILSPSTNTPTMNTIELRSSSNDAISSSSKDTAGTVIGDSIFYFLMGLIGLLVVVFVFLCLERWIRDRRAAKKDKLWDPEQGEDAALPDEELRLGGGATRAGDYTPVEDAEEADAVEELRSGGAATRGDGYAHVEDAEQDDAAEELRPSRDATQADGFTEVGLSE